MVINALTTKSERESERRGDPREGGSERKCKRNVEAAQQLKVQVPQLLLSLSLLLRRLLWLLLSFGC